jgi:hypothetical protein
MTTAPTVSLTADDVLRIAANAERSLPREAEIIAYAYHQVAADLVRQVGDRDSNWFCYAKWTSRAIAVSLDLERGSQFWDDLARGMKVPRRFRWALRRVMTRLLGGSYLKGLSLVNRSIFLEMATFAANLWGAPDSIGDQVQPAAQELPQTFISSLLDNDADPSYLSTAAQLLTKARFTTDAALRTELILGANVSLSAYEQRRAQKVLEFVLYRPVRWLLRVSWRMPIHALTRRPLCRFELYAEPHEAQSWIVRALEDWWARSYTRRVWAVQTPIGEVRVGKPLQAPPGFDPQMVPPPFHDEQVKELVNRFAAQRSDLACAGTDNWLSYPERMRFIVDYFRLYQHVHELFEPPYDETASTGLAEELRDGQLPVPVPITETGQLWPRRYQLPRIVDPEPLT